MRVLPRFLLSTAAGLGAGLAASFASAVWLRSAATVPDFVWRVAPVGKLTVWILTGAHAVPAQVRAGVRTTDRLGRLGDLLGDRLARVGFEGSVVLVPLTITILVGVVVAVVARWSGARTLRDAVIGSVASGLAHGALLAGLAAASGADLAVRGGIGIVEGTVSVAPPAGVAFLLGFAFGTCFALAGSLSHPATRALLPSGVRSVGAGWVRAIVVGFTLSTLALVIAGAARATGESLPSVGGSLPALGALLLGGNAVTAALVLFHGASMSVGLEVGPFAGWRQIDYLHFGASQRPASFGWWFGVLIPIAAGLVAARGALRREPATGAATIAVGFGIAWGLTLALLAVLLRVSVLSDFSLARIASGSSGSASVNPGIALVLGLGWGAVTSLAGWALFRSRAGAPSPEVAAAAVHPGAETAMRDAPTSAYAPEAPTAARVGVAPGGAVPAWTCPVCQRANVAGARFCAGCGHRGWE